MSKKNSNNNIYVRLYLLCICTRFYFLIISTLLAHLLAEWLALWPSVRQVLGSTPELGVVVRSGSESTLSSRSRSN